MIVYVKGQYSQKFSDVINIAKGSIVGEISFFLKTKRTASIVSG